MPDILQAAIQGASQALALLSKVRCVESYSPTQQCKPKFLHSWPSPFENDSDIVSLISSNEKHCEHFKVKSYLVPYDVYEKLKAIDMEEIDIIRSNRILLDVIKIVAERKRITSITAAWDISRHPDRRFPNSMSDSQALEDFAAYKDSMLVIDREDEKYSIKLPASAYREVLKEKPELKRYPISCRNRVEYIGDLVDTKGRSGRYVVHIGNRNHLQNVLRQTSNAIERIFDSIDWRNA